MKACVKIEGRLGSERKIHSALGSGRRMMRMRSNESTDFYFVDDFIHSFISSKSYDRYITSSKASVI